MRTLARKSRGLTRPGGQYGAVWVAKSLQVLDAARAGDPTDVRTWDRWDALRPHVAASVRYADETGVSEPTSVLMSKLGTLLHAKALYDEAEPLMRRALDIDEASYGRCQGRLSSLDPGEAPRLI